MSLITAQQSRDARRELSLSQTDVTKALDLNRQYLSEFETGFSTRLTSAQLKKLRKFYENKIEEFNSNGEEIELSFGSDEIEDPIISLEKHQAKRLTFKVGDEISDEDFNSALKAIQTNDLRLAEILNVTASRDEGFLGDGNFTPEALTNFREAFSRLSSNYLIIRSLTGWPILGLSAGNVNPSKDSIFALLQSEFVKSFRSYDEVDLVFGSDVMATGSE